jgi:hypothetical protein
MLRSYREVRAIEVALVFDRLDDAREHARVLADLAPDAHIGGDALRSVRERAGEIVRSPSARAALPTFAELASACGDCHEGLRIDVRPSGAAEPADDGSVTARMARHQWAAERLFDGLIGPSDARWREGLVVLAGPPLLPDAMSDARDRYAALEAIGARLAALAGGERETPPDRSARAYAYARVLEACAGCHALAAR